MNLNLNDCNCGGWFAEEESQDKEEVDDMLTLGGNEEVKEGK